MVTIVVDLLAVLLHLHLKADNLYDHVPVMVHCISIHYHAHALHQCGLAIDGFNTVHAQ